MNLNTILRSSLAVVTLAAAVACADSATPTAPRSVAPPLADWQQKDQEKSEVAKCESEEEDWNTERIGSRGGRISVGGATLTVPAGALSRTVSITAHTLPTASASVQFLPEGLQFAKPATLKMDYSKCDTPLLGVKVVYVQAGSVTETEPTQNYPLLKFVVAKINHFSSYAVAY